MIGPAKNSAYIDTMHVPMHYKKVMDDKGCPLAALLIKKGDIAYYNYDLWVAGCIYLFWKILLLKKTL